MAAQGEEFGGGFAVGPGVGHQYPLVRLPLLTNARQITSSAVGVIANSTRFDVMPSVSGHR